MHRTLGDGHLSQGGKTYYQDENPGVNDATQVRHQEMNAIQEEIARLIENAGFTLNADSESFNQMIQLTVAVQKMIDDTIDSTLSIATKDIRIYNSGGGTIVEDVDDGIEYMTVGSKFTIVRLPEYKFTSPSVGGAVDKLMIRARVGGGFDNWPSALQLQGDFVPCILYDNNIQYAGHCKGMSGVSNAMELSLSNVSGNKIRFTGEPFGVNQTIGYPSQVFLFRRLIV